jgi:hypothetical protein
MPPREPGQGPGASVRRSAGQQAGKPVTPGGWYMVVPHPSISGLLGIHWHEPGVPDGAPIITVGEPRLPLLAVALDTHLARHTPVVALANALAQARAALAGDSANARSVALRDIATAVHNMLGGTVDAAVADMVPPQDGGTE